MAETIRNATRTQPAPLESTPAETTTSPSSSSSGTRGPPVGSRDAAETVTARPTAREPAESSKTSRAVDAEVLGKQRQAQIEGPAALARRSTPTPPVLLVDQRYPAGETYGQVIEFSFDRLMTREQVIDVLYGARGLPTRYDGTRAVVDEFSKDVELTGLDSFVGWVATKWRLTLPNANADSSRMKAEAVQQLFPPGAPAAAQGLPPWTPDRSAACLRSGLPPTPGDPGMAYVKQLGQTTVWREGSAVFWFDAKKRQYEGLRLSDKPHMKTYNRDMEHYIAERFLPPSQAVRAFVNQWRHINVTMLGTLGYALAGTLGTNTGGLANPISLDDAVVDAAAGRRK